MSNEATIRPVAPKYDITVRQSAGTLKKDQDEIIHPNLESMDDGDPSTRKNASDLTSNPPALDVS